MNLVRQYYHNHMTFNERIDIKGLLTTSPYFVAKI
jgi:hypothetical protein